VKKSVLNLPTSDQLEITLNGSGGGYGESVVVHAGNGEWMIVDRCQAPTESEPLPLQYLRSIGVNLTTSVKRILYTHWDDDYIRGMSQIVEHCQSAKIFISKVLDIGKFLQLVR
jgi:glyoxylase-like metal-dependent hydrolase (beta-lactamase superfamily II)